MKTTIGTRIRINAEDNYLCFTHNEDSKDIITISTSNGTEDSIIGHIIVERDMKSLIRFCDKLKNILS